MEIIFFVLAAALFLALVFWGDMHEIIGLAAYDCLPDWVKERWDVDLSAGGLSSPLYRKAPSIRSAREKIARACIIMDEFYSIPEVRRYCSLPNGKPVPHGPADENFEGIWLSLAPSSLEATRQVAEHLLGNVVGAIRQRDIETATLYAGSLAHFLQEASCPSHAAPNRIFEDYFQELSSGHYYRYHNLFDDLAIADSLLARKPPVLLGTDVREAAFLLTVKFDKVVREARAKVEPLVRSIREGRQDERARLLTSCADLAVPLVASAWYTAFSIAEGRFEPEEVKSLSRISLTEMVPYFVHPGGPYGMPLENKNVEEDRLVDLYMLVREGSDLIEKKIDRGLGLYSYVSAKYLVDGSLWPRFRCAVGLSSRLCRDEDTLVRFFIDVSPEVDRQYSPEVEYGPPARRVFECQLRRGESARVVNLSLHGAKTLMLSARAERGEDPHIVVAEPLICRDQ